MPSALYIQNKELLLKPENLYGKSRNAHFLLVLYTVWIFELRSKHNNKTHTNYLDTLRKERERQKNVLCPHLKHTFNQFKIPMKQQF